jgi:hypothetical protein
MAVTRVANNSIRQNRRNTLTGNLAGLGTGGTVVDDGGYRYHTFLSSADFVCVSSGTVDVLMVAGGGGGSGNNGNGAGGGGAGGLIYQSVAVTAQTYSIVIGSGGAIGTVGMTPQASL